MVILYIFRYGIFSLGKVMDPVFPPGIRITCFVWSSNLLMGLCRERVTNLCTSSYCHTSLRRHAGVLMFRSYCDYSLVMITHTFSFPHSLMITSAITLKLLICNCMSFMFFRESGCHVDEAWWTIYCFLKNIKWICSNKQSGTWNVFNYGWVAVLW